MCLPQSSWFLMRKLRFFLSAFILGTSIVVLQQSYLLWSMISFGGIVILILCCLNRDSFCLFFFWVFPLYDYWTFSLPEGFCVSQKMKAARSMNFICDRGEGILLEHYYLPLFIYLLSCVAFCPNFQLSIPL